MSTQNINPDSVSQSSLTRGESQTDLNTHYLKQELYDLIRHDSLVFEFLQQGVLDGLWYWDLENPENEWMSDQFWQLFGYDPSDKKHLVSEWQDIIHADDLEIAKKNLALHLASPAYPYDQTVRYRHADGSTVWVRCRGVAIYGEQGKPIRMLGAHNDITRLMQQHESLIKERLDNAKLIREATILSQDLAAAEAEIGALKSQLEKEMLFCDVTGFMNLHHFNSLVKMRASTAARLNIPVNAIVLKIDNHDAIVRNFGRENLTIILASLNTLISNAVVDSLVSQLAETLLIFNIGYSHEQLVDTAKKLEIQLKQHHWGMVKPDLTLATQVCQANAESKPDELIQELIVNAVALPETNEKLLK